MSDMYQEYIENYYETLIEVAQNIREHGEAFTVEDGERYEYEPLEVVAEMGRPWTVVLTVGGPHVEIAADGYDVARLYLYWGGERREKYDHDGKLATVLDYFTGRYS